MSRKEKKYHFIYKTTNILTKRYYYGMHSSDSLDDGYLGSGVRIRRSIKKYGEENHKREIVEFCKTRKELKDMEKEIINLNEIGKKDCMNLIVGGEGGFTKKNQMLGSIAGHVALKKLRETDLEWVKKWKNNTSIASNRVFNEGRGKKTKNKYNWLGKKHRPESIKKMRESSKGMGLGSKNSQYDTMWITNGIDNKKIKKNDDMPNGWYKGRKLNLGS